MTNHNRILVMAHGHPEIIRGGGELAAYQLFKTFQNHEKVEQAWFLAADPVQNGASGRMKLHRKDEYLWEQGLSDFFRMEAANKHEVTGYFAELIRALRPTVVQTHHYFNFGLEYLKVIKDVDPTIKTVLTLHEYMAICPNFGQMMSIDGETLCEDGFDTSIRRCNPNRSADDLWLRKHRFQSYFKYVDHFIAPSEFLRQRYIEWGLAPDKITHIPNGQPQRTTLPTRENGSEGRNRFAFFGQIGPHKGLDVLLESLTALGKDRKKISFQIHGANLQYQRKPFRKKIRKLLKPLIDDQTVQWMGSYRPDELSRRMQNVDWVCVPSIWYENAPLVIQEAFAFGRPVLTTDIGGMKEMVDDGVNGRCLPRLSSSAWAATFKELGANPDIWDKLHSGIKPPASLFDTSNRILRKIDSLQKVTAQ